MISSHLPEFLIVLTLAPVVFGPKRMPEIGSSLGQGIRHFRRGMFQLDDGLQLQYRALAIPGVHCSQTPDEPPLPTRQEIVERSAGNSESYRRRQHCRVAHRHPSEAVVSALVVSRIDLRIS
jgi:sec-independent protein translocase protein TatA